VKVSRELCRLLNASPSTGLHPPSTSLTNRGLRPWGRNHSRVGSGRVDNGMITALAPMFDLVLQALRCPGFESEALGALLGTGLTHWSLAVVRPEKIRPRNFRRSRCQIGPGVDDQDVSVGPEGLVVIYIGTYVVPQVDEAIYRVVYHEFSSEGRLQIGLRKRQNLAEVFPGDARISYSKSPNFTTTHCAENSSKDLSGSGYETAAPQDTRARTLSRLFLRCSPNRVTPKICRKTYGR